MKKLRLGNTYERKKRFLKTKEDTKKDSLRLMKIQKRFFKT